MGYVRNKLLKWQMGRLNFIARVIVAVTVVTLIALGLNFIAIDSYGVDPLAYFREGRCSQGGSVLRNKKFLNKISFVLSKMRENFCKNYTPFASIEESQRITRFHATKADHADLSQPLVSMNYKGGLGNNICQYLSLYLLKHIFDVRIAVYPSMFRTLTKNFRFQSIPEICSSKSFQTPTVNITYYDLFRILLRREEEGSPSGGTSEGMTGASYYVKNFPCPVEVMMSFRKILIQKLMISTGIKFYARNYLEDLLSRFSGAKNKTLVSVHVRRNDYHHHMRVLYSRRVLTSCYYHNALKYFRERFDNEVVFIFASDDLRWCQSNFDSPDVLIAGQGVEGDPIFDFALLSLCDHHIAGLGTFGFLSAFYGGGIIMHPLVDTDRPSDIENSYLCTISDQTVPMLDESLIDFE